MTGTLAWMQKATKLLLLDKLFNFNKIHSLWAKGVPLAIEGGFLANSIRRPLGSLVKTSNLLNLQSLNGWVLLQRNAWRGYL
jgi:hypothetical protein